MRKIYLLRHCETEQFEKKRCIGVTDITLDEAGLRQARQLKEYFRSKKLSAVYCSDALRAVKTAEIIASTNMQPVKLHDLHEINMGDWDGMYFEDIKSKYPDAYRRRGLDFASFTPPNGESFAACRQRAFRALSRILDGTGGDVAIVAHAGFNRALICGLCGIDLQRLFTIPQPFGCINLLWEQNGSCIVKEVGIRCG